MLKQPGLELEPAHDGTCDHGSRVGVRRLRPELRVAPEFLGHERRELEVIARQVQLSSCLRIGAGLKLVEGEFGVADLSGGVAVILSDGIGGSTCTPG